MKKLVINHGDKYSRLTILKEVEKINGKRCFLCKCDCGNKRIVDLGNIKNGRTRSCGCLHNLGNNKKHGMCGTKIYKTWTHMKSRCNNPNGRQYKDYGGRGITICDEWNNFENFYNDMGPTYKEGLSIDRINVNLNYCKSNCKWATAKEQQRNRRNNVIYNGKCVSEWCEDLGLNRNTVWTRIHKGWTIERALFTIKNK